MLDIKFVRENPEVVKENIRKKFQDEKLPLVDEVIALDIKIREIKTKGDQLRSERNSTSKMIGMLMGQKKFEEANEKKARVVEINNILVSLEKEEADVAAELKKKMMVIPNIIDPSVPIGKDDSENVEVQRYLEPTQYDFEVPYHLDIIEKVHGIDLDAARRVSGNGFYYLMGDIARLHSAVLSYARDFMIDKGFTYVIPPYMIRGDVVTGVMSFAEMDSNYNKNGIKFK
jgi:seryl-tRNA synthetase